MHAIEIQSQLRFLPMIDEIKAKLKASNFTGAESRARDLLDREPHNGTGWALLGQILVASSRAIEGREALEHANTLVPLGADATVALASCYLGEQHTRLALEMLVHVSQQTDATASTLRAAAAAADSVDHPWVSKAICERSLKRFPDEPQTFYELGYYCARLGSQNLMEANARKAIELDPDNVCYRVGLASSLMKQNRTDEAYTLVKAFGPKEVDQVCCNSCRTGLLAIFEAANDSLRASLCQSRMQQQEPGDSHGH